MYLEPPFEWKRHDQAYEKHHLRNEQKKDLETRFSKYD